MPADTSASEAASAGSQMRRAYLDHASTSPLRPAAADAIRDALDAGPAGPLAGDPGRIHQEGMAARVALEQARDAVAAAFGALAVPARLIDEAVEVGAIDPVDSGDGPGRSDSSIVRAVRWLAALHGVLATDALPVGVPVDGHTLGRLLSGDLLRGWGAQPDRLAGATALADHWSTR